MTGLHSFDHTVFGGTPLQKAQRALIMVHGRGDTTQKMQNLAKEVADERYHLVFPKATNKTWYPKGFMAATQENQPWLDATMDYLAKALHYIKEGGISDENIFFLGFSQGACVALEFPTRNATQYGGVMVLSGGLIGPEIDLSKYTGDYQGTPVFMGCSDIDHHIPLQRLNDSADVLMGMNAHVDLRIYPGMGHMINEDEIATVKKILQ